MKKRKIGKYKVLLLEFCLGIIYEKKCISDCCGGYSKAN